MRTAVTEGSATEQDCVNHPRQNRLEWVSLNQNRVKADCRVPKRHHHCFCVSQMSHQDVYAADLSSFSECHEAGIVFLVITAVGLKPSTAVGSTAGLSSTFVSGNRNVYAAENQVSFLK